MTAPPPTKSGTYEFLDAVAFSTVRGLIGLDEAEICISGAAPLPPDVMTWFQTIGVPLSEGYGMSETTALLSWSHMAKAGYVGRPTRGGGLPSRGRRGTRPRRRHLSRLPRRPRKS